MVINKETVLSKDGKEVKVQTYTENWEDDYGSPCWDSNVRVLHHDNRKSIVLTNQSRTNKSSRLHCPPYHDQAVKELEEEGYRIVNNKRKLRMLSINEEFLIALIKGEGSVIGDELDGAEVVSVHHDFQTKSFLVTLTSPKFSPVEDGTVIPRVSCTMQRNTKPAKFIDDVFDEVKEKLKKEFGLK